MKIIYTIWMWLVLGACTIFWGTLYLIFFAFDGRKFFYDQISRFWARSIVFLSRAKIEVEGLEKIPAGPRVFMANHQSYFDAISLVVYLPPPVRFVAKKILQYLPVFGQLLWITGQIIIDRSNPKQAFAELDKAAEKIKQGASVLVFPEGTRSPDHKLGQFKKGGFILTIKAGAPIVPISISGTQSMMPKGKYSFKRPKLVKIKIGDLIATKDFGAEQKQELMYQVRRAMISGFDPETEEAKANQGELESPGPKVA